MRFAISSKFSYWNNESYCIFHVKRIIYPANFLIQYQNFLVIRL